VRRKAFLIGTVAILMAAATAGQSPVYSKAVSSVRAFQRNFVDLKKADSMSTVERFVFSLVLSSSKAPTADATSHTRGIGRT
jgi:hypothetical protein